MIQNADVGGSSPHFRSGREVQDYLSNSLANQIFQSRLLLFLCELKMHHALMFRDRQEQYCSFIYMTRGIPCTRRASNAFSLRPRSPTPYHWENSRVRPQIDANVLLLQ